MSEQPELSVVVPVYNEAGNVDEFLRRLVPLLEANVRDYEIIFSADPCTDGTEDLIREPPGEQPGDQAVALLAALRAADRDARRASSRHPATPWSSWTCDLQDPPELLVEMLAKWRDGYDVVYAQRRSRTGETLIKRIGRQGRLRRDQPLRRRADPRTPATSASSTAGSSTSWAVQGDPRLPPRAGRPRRVRADGRRVRTAGPPLRQGQLQPLVGSLRIGFNGLVAFSSALLNLSTVLGFVAAALAFVSGVVYFIATLAGVGLPGRQPDDRHARAAASAGSS